MLKTPRRRGTDDDEVQHRQAKRAAPDAVWATELPTDLWKRCLDFAYGPASACVDPLAPLKAAATLATLGDDRRAELEAREARRNAATKAWQTVVDAHDVLSNEKSRSDVDRKASAEAVGNALGTLGGVAFIGLQNMGKMAAGAVGAAVEAGASAVEASKDDS